MLTRLQSDDKAESRELDEKDDMNRRSGKIASRIPTFNKRPAAAASSGTEHQGVPRRDSPEVGGHELVARSRLQDGRSLPQPSVRLPKVGLEVPFPLSSAESAQSPFMSATPRPSLRGQPEEKQPETQEAESEPDVTLPRLPSDGSIHEAEEAEKKEEGEEGDLTRPIDVRPAVAVEAIMDEEPPWSSRGASVPELKDSRSSSDVERDDELTSREGEEDAKMEEKMKETEEGQGREEEEKVREPQEPHENHPMSLNGAEPQKKPAGAFSPTHSGKVSVCFFFLLLMLLDFFADKTELTQSSY